MTTTTVQLSHCVYYCGDYDSRICHLLFLAIFHASWKELHVFQNGWCCTNIFEAMIYLHSVEGCRQQLLGWLLAWACCWWLQKSCFPVRTKEASLLVLYCRQGMNKDPSPPWIPWIFVAICWLFEWQQHQSCSYPIRTYLLCVIETPWKQNTSEEHQ